MLENEIIENNNKIFNVFKKYDYRNNNKLINEIINFINNEKLEIFYIENINFNNDIRLCIFENEFFKFNELKKNLYKKYNNYNRYIEINIYTNKNKTYLIINYIDY